MHQQVNLFQPVFRQQRKVFSAATLAQIAGVVLLLLLVIFGHARWTLGTLETSAEALQQHHDHLQSQMAELEEALQTPDNTALEAEVEQLKSRIDDRKSLLVQFDRLVLQDRGGFANQFRLLAERRIPGLWLEGVSANGTGQMEIRGVTLDDQLVPIYLQHLEKQQGLSESSFETVSMTRSDADKPHIHFVLRNYKGKTSWQ